MPARGMISARRGMVALIGLGLLLVGCQPTAHRADDQRTAEGQVLKGSISDAMLPYDTVTSQPPLAPARSAANPADAASDAASHASGAASGADTAASTSMPSSATP